jgi:hypothetical protein
VAIGKPENIQMIWRVIATLVILTVWGWLEGAVNLIEPLVTGPAAGLQFDNSNVSYVASNILMKFGHWGNAAVGIIAVVLLLMIWLSAVMKAARSPTASAILVALGLGTLFASPSYAYFDTTDKTEAYTILPNESAFWIPDVGANKASQTNLDSIDYLNSNKVALKRFIIPHQKLSGTGGNWGWDSYVPTGRLIIVDRTPYSREWVDAQDRGTSKDKQGFPCQSKEGLNITVGISIGTEVTEGDSATYLYHFGVQAPQGQRTDPQVIFTSVYYSRTVANVMDDVGRKKVQTLVCEQIATKTFDEANAQATGIMASVRKDATDYFKSVGITLDFIGWADTFEFDKSVQDAVNRRYIAIQDQAIATSLAPYAETIEKLAAAQALRNFGEKSDGRLPTTIVGLPTNLGGLLGTLLNVHPVPEDAAPAVAVPPAHH